MNGGVKQLLPLRIRRRLQRFEEDLDTLLLTPFEQARLEVDLLLGDLAEVQVLVNHPLHELEADLIAFIDIYRTDKGLKRIAIDMIVVVADLWREDDQPV